jgi:hypothetical protein
MRPGKLNNWRKICILVGYILVVLATRIHIVSPILYYQEKRSPLYVNSLKDLKAQFGGKFVSLDKSTFQQE